MLSATPHKHVPTANSKPHPNKLGCIPVDGTYQALGDTSSSNEEALGQMTLGFYALAGNQLASEWE